MPVCDVCNGEDYYEEDGQFYCNVCNTQSQSMVVMELDETHSQSLPSHSMLREVGKTKHKKEKKCEYERGRPWTKYEAYQLIIQNQARALIHHKADRSVRDVVLQLWAKYLSLLKVAFVSKDEARLVPEVFEQSKQKWDRELNRGGMDNPEVKPTKMKRKLKNNAYNSFRSKAKIQRLEEERERNLYAEALQGETFYEGDNPLEERDEVDNDQRGTDSEDSCLWSDSDGSDFEDLAGKDKLLGSVQHMNLPKTLAFTYLACIFASRWITVSDILRWVHDGSMPYLETTHLLFPDMKLSAFDQRLFTPFYFDSEGVKSVCKWLAKNLHHYLFYFFDPLESTHSLSVRVTPKRLRYDAGKLLHFLGFEKIPEIPVKYICMATIQALDLPEALVPRAVKLLRQCPVDVSYKRKVASFSQKILANIDALCAAYVLVTVKQIFGLDDCKERILSKYTKALQARLGEDIALFDWGTWQAHITYKFLPGLCLQDISGQSRQVESSVETLCQTFKAAAFKDRVFSNSKLYTKWKTRKVAAFKQENREMLKHSASVLEERWKNREETAARIRAEEQAADGGTEVTDASRSQEMSAWFRSSALDHILKPEEFIHSVLWEPASSDCSGPRPSSKDDLTVMKRNTVLSKSRLFTGGVHSASPVSSNYASMHPSQAIPSSLTLDSPTEKAPASLSSSADPSEVASELLYMLSQADVGGYVAYHKVKAKKLREKDVLRDLRSKQHHCYKWLLKVLSRWTFCPETDIEKMVWEIECRMSSKSLLVRS